MARLESAAETPRQVRRARTPKSKRSRLANSNNLQPFPDRAQEREREMSNYYFRPFPTELGFSLARIYATILLYSKSPVCDNLPIFPKSTLLQIGQKITKNISAVTVSYALVYRRGHL